MDVLETLSARALSSWSDARHATADAFVPALRLGVTGLARSGKTVFITSLVHNLLNPGNLPFFSPATERRFIRAYLAPQPDDAVPRFDYEGHLEKLTRPEPEWPESTRSISQLRLTLEFFPSSALWRVLGTSRLHLDIVDYPGEWLLDLPMLEQSFETWSNESIALSRKEPRLQAAAEWHSFLGSIDAHAPQNETVARQGFDVFSRYLAHCRDESLSLSSLSPGRFLMLGDLAGSPAATFFPLQRSQGETASRESLWAMMDRRYEAYKTHAVRPFFRDHFARLDRQIVLTDVLTALNAGADAVLDLQSALTGILSCFRQGEKSWLSLLGGRRIDRIVFAATKADHLHHENHDRLEAILRLITERAVVRAEYAGAEVRSFAIASVRATREAQVRKSREMLPSIVGVPLTGERLGGRVFDGKQDLAVFPGDLPENATLALSPGWGAGPQRPLSFIRFRPPAQNRLYPAQNAALPHIRLDRVLTFLLGDKLA